MEIELLVVPDCHNEAAAESLITAAVAETGVNATIARTTIATQDEARQRNFVGSPTILLNGHDPFPVGEASVGLACRLYPTAEGLRGVPLLKDLRQALKRAPAS